MVAEYATSVRASTIVIGAPAHGGMAPGTFATAEGRVELARPGP
jgi:hypothetical protein